MLYVALQLTMTTCTAVQVLVASDAIGMGLNLNIRRIIFHTLRMFDPATGSTDVPVAPERIRQIAGAHRACLPRP